MIKDIKIDFAYKTQFSINDIIVFIEKNWIRKTLLSQNKFYQWQFKSNMIDSSILAVHNNNIVGFMGLNKRSFFLEEEELDGAELTTWIINNNYRNKGLAKLMIEFIKLNFDVAYGANITPEALKVYLRLGFYFVKEIDRVVKILSYNKVEKIAYLAPTVKKVFDNKKLINGNYRLISFESIELTGYAYNGFNRSSSYLNWRYVQHPYYDYKALELLNLNEIIYIIFRLENINKEIKSMIITDVLGDSKNFDLSGIEKYAIDNGVDLIEFYSTSSYIISKFVLNKYIHSRDLRDFIDVPYLYNPLEKTASKSYSLIYFGKDKYLSKLVNYGNIYITKQDCDLDRPNDYYLEKVLYQ